MLEYGHLSVSYACLNPKSNQKFRIIRSPLLLGTIFLTSIAITVRSVEPGTQNSMLGQEKNILSSRLISGSFLFCLQTVPQASTFEKQKYSQLYWMFFLICAFCYPLPLILNASHVRVVGSFRLMPLLLWFRLMLSLLPLCLIFTCLPVFILYFCSYSFLHLGDSFGTLSWT